VNHLYGRVVKRLLDTMIAAAALAVLSPLMAFVAIVVRCTLGAPVLFRQQRPGLNGRRFVILKFRTMREPDDSSNQSDGDRLGLTGRTLRALSLDELPQLVNVLMGDMSLVGPRPLLLQYLDRYTPAQSRRHDVRPGITGWAQVNGRNAISWEERLAMDVWYVDHQSLSLDLSILLRTAGAVLCRRGINAPGEATMCEFRGIER
jgi:lipopolysaccharide/colanic/teichoic acid biosynthesis glycosyltransferase